MKFVFTKHALKRMAEREIRQGFVVEALQTPTEVLYDYGNKRLVKKLYTKSGVKRLLLVVCKKEGEILKIITVIDTSKIEKYL